MDGQIIALKLTGGVWSNPWLGVLFVVPVWVAYRHFREDDNQRKGNAWQAIGAIAATATALFGPLVSRLQDPPGQPKESVAIPEVSEPTDAGPSGVRGSATSRAASLPANFEGAGLSRKAVTVSGVTQTPSLVVELKAKRCGEPTELSTESPFDGPTSFQATFALDDSSASSTRVRVEVADDEKTLRTFFIDRTETVFVDVAIAALQTKKVVVRLGIVGTQLRPCDQAEATVAIQRPTYSQSKP